MEQIDYDLLFRWFVGLPMDAAVWHPTVFAKNRDRLLEADVAREFLATLMALARVKRLLSREHFTVDGTLVDAWASMKSFRPKDGLGEPPGPGRNGERDFRGETRSNATHASTTDQDARLYRKGDRQGSRPVLHGPRLDGKPQRAGGGGHVDPRHRHGRARGGAGDARPAQARRAHYLGGRQGL